MSNIRPKRFVSLHAHSNLSVGDAIGLPQEHMDYAIKNGMDGLVLTDHGTMSGISHQQLHSKKLEGRGIKFKAIPGVEAYFLDSLSDWRNLVKVQKANQQLQKTMANIGNEFADTEADMDTKHGKETSEDEEGGTVIEIESETKSERKFDDPIKQRNHLVLLPKNDTGLKSLFRVVSESYIDGFYRYPRIDFDILKRHAKGNIVASSACIGGRLAKIVFDNQDPNVEWRSWKVTDYNIEKIQKELKTLTDKFVDCLCGEENYYLELQMNRLGPQQLVNYHLMELAKRTGLKLVVTTDSHYSNPEHWREREIYKAMAWSSKTKGTIDPNALPKTIDELKCELYPKNAEQLWKTYLEQKAVYPEVYTDDQLICDAIERTHDIAHNLIGDVSIDRKIKLPGIGQLIEKNRLESLLETFMGMSEDDIALKELVQLGIDGLRKKNKANDEVYIARLKHELEVIKHLKFAKYFLTFHKIMAVVRDELLSGTGRGSAAGSLLAYVLEITQIDPIKYNLLFARMLTKSKVGWPDIDCLHAATLIPLENSTRKALHSIVVGDRVLDHQNNPRNVLAVSKRFSKKEESIFSLILKRGNVYGSFVASGSHRLLNEKCEEIFVKDIKIGDKLHSPDNSMNIIVHKQAVKESVELVDICVEETQTFQFIPFNCCEINTNIGTYVISVNTYSFDSDLYVDKFSLGDTDEKTKRDCTITKIW